MRKFLAVSLILAAVSLSYGPAVRDGFVWDDTALILRDPLIRSWRLIPEGFNHFLFTDATASDFYRPIQRFTYMLDYAAFAFKAAPYHTTNIIWHAAAAIALFILAEELLLFLGIESRKRHSDWTVRHAGLGNSSDTELCRHLHFGPSRSTGRDVWFPRFLFCSSKHPGKSSERICSSRGRDDRFSSQHTKQGDWLCFSAARDRSARI